MKVVLILLFGWTGAVAAIIGSVNMLANTNGGIITKESAIDVGLVVAGMGAVASLGYFIGMLKQEQRNLRNELDGLHSWRHAMQAKWGGRRKSDTDETAAKA